MANKRKNGSGGGTALNDAFRQAVAEQLLDGADPEALARQFASSAGLGLGLVQAEVARAAKSPYLLAAQGLRTRLHERLGKWEWVLQNGARLAARDPAALAIPVLDRPDGEALYRDHYRAHRPALIRGLFDHWPARRLWSLAHVAAALGDRPVRVQWNREADSDYEGNSDAHGAFRPYSEIAARLAAPGDSNDFYVTANNSDANRAAFAPLFAEAGEIPGILYEGTPRGMGHIWIGPRGTITPWHHDLTNNLLIQLVGRKRVRMVASHDTPLMRNWRHCFSAWGTDDLPPGPAAPGKPAVLECEIGPGDAIFLPVGWWHHVEGLEPHIGMSFTSFVWDNDFYSDYRSYGPL
ncbi:cupin-like domain-containing protein [Sphingomonas sp. CBMAI 2297]|uniref:cupin-like domain-containing protein n=1 Tax=Sphingomonas sp. CBMAI 2297 TaxID=2991720 RepID=UPI002454FABA|nr:cupin-like domain-containing protein [Sphingomonas sp. CBMAI 2297]MDH4745057.1 cupin-like domain-containing protein [Sphingomonas sp. CBMAI 2297]